MYSNESINVWRYIIFMSSVINFTSLVESVLSINTFVVVPSAVGVPTSSGYSTFWPAIVILTLCSFALMSQTKQGKETFFAVGHVRDGNENEGVGAFSGLVILQKTADFVCKGIMSRLATLSLNEASNELFDTGFFASDRV